MKEPELRTDTVDERSPETYGRIFNIQRYSLNDGPGIRTVVFFKGCPLRCGWCCNPESFELQSHLTFNAEKCLGCGRCVEACPHGARSADGIDESKCRLCGKCVEVCPSGALEMIGKPMTVEQVLDEVEKDRLFYESSGGGVTLSGGEILAQWRFAVNLMEALRAKYLHIAIETTGYAPWERVEKVVDGCDLVLYDLKHMDPALHKKYTGVSNELILRNALAIAEKGKDLIFRLPLIGGINDDENNVLEAARFAKEAGVRELHLLPYHRLGESKYYKIGRDFTCEAYTPDEEYVAELKRKLEADGFTVKVGG